MNYGKQAKEAHKDIPKALLYCIPTLMVVYGGVAIVASGVLPLDQVAGQPLTLVAKNILNPALFTVFMIGGPVLALSSSINSTISNNCIPVAQSCKDGWLPKSWAAQNRRGAYWKLMTFTYLMGLFPLLFEPVCIYLHFYQFLQKPETSGSNHQSDSHCSMHGLRMV